MRPKVLKASPSCFPGTFVALESLTSREEALPYSHLPPVPSCPGGKGPPLGLQPQPLSCVSPMEASVSTEGVLSGIWEGVELCLPRAPGLPSAFHLRRTQGHGLSASKTFRCVQFASPVSILSFWL